MTALDARRLAQLAAYRHGGRAFGTAPAATVHDNAATRPIHTHHTGQHTPIAMPDPDGDAEVPRWRHAATRPSPWAPAVTLTVAVLLLAMLVVAVTW